MDFCILGPLEVHDGDHRLPLGGAKQRALLGLLLLHANEVVSSDRLVDELWGEAGLGEGSKALHVAVSRLRKVLEPDRAVGREDGPRVLVTRPPGYQLNLEPVELDVQRFERLVGEGRAALAAGDPAAASDSLREALALWRGPPLGDLAYEAFAQAEIARLEERRVAALEDRIEADLGLGLHQELIGELQALVARQPLRERPRAQLMLALYRSGRQAEALEVFRDARRALVDELGIEPGRGLQELEGAILRHDARLDPGTGTEPEAQQEGGVFVGRRKELAELGGGLDDALAGHGRLFLIVGEPGIGKSRLADEVMRRARARGVGVLVGRCWEAGGAPAFWPWVQALRSYVRGTEPDALRPQLGAAAADLGQLLPDLRELYPDLPEPPAFESEGARFRLFEAVSSFLKSAAQLRPLVLVLDDLHAADESSLLMLQFVAREISDSRLLVVCGLRSVDPTPRHPLTVTLAELAREPHTAQIALAGLREPDVAQYIELLTGTQPGLEPVEAIHAGTGGNPLFVTEVVRLLDAEGRIDKADAGLQIPPGVRSVIGQRVGRLSDPCRRLLSAASVLGREFGLDAVALLADLPRDELLDVLDEAMAERVVGDVPGSPGRLRFGHALIRDTLYEDLTPADRARLHQDAAIALATVYADDLEPHLAELAHHSFAAVPAAGPDRAIDYARRAADRAASQLAYEEAVRLYEMVLALVRDDVVRCDLLLALGDAQARAGDATVSKQAVRRAAELAGELDLPEQFARAALGYGGRIMWDVSRDDEHLVPLLQGALAALGQEDSPLRARLLARLAGGPLRDASVPPERKASLSREALEMARRIGDVPTLAYALDGYIPANESPDNTKELLELSTELLGVAIELGDKERALEAHEHRLMRLSELGEIAEAKDALEAMAKLAQDLRQPAQKWLVAVCGARLALLEGRFAEAERLITEARGLGETAQSWNAGVAYRLQLYVLRRQQGRLDEVEELVRRSVDEYPTYQIWRCVLAQMTAELGHEAESRKVLSDLAKDNFAGLSFDDQWLASISFLGEATAGLGDTRRVPVLYGLLLPYADRVAVSYPELSIGSVARYLALLAATTERWGDAQGHFDHALEMNERIGARPSLAHTQSDYAEMLVERDGPGDRERAGPLLDSARSLYNELGMERYEAATTA